MIFGGLNREILIFFAENAGIFVCLQIFSYLCSVINILMTEGLLTMAITLLIEQYPFRSSPADERVEIDNKRSI